MTSSTVGVFTKDQQCGDNRHHEQSEVIFLIESQVCCLLPSCDLSVRLLPWVCNDVRHPSRHCESDDNRILKEVMEYFDFKPQSPF